MPRLSITRQHMEHPILMIPWRAQTTTVGITTRSPIPIALSLGILTTLKRNLTTFPPVMPKRQTLVISFSRHRSPLLVVILLASSSALIVQMTKRTSFMSAQMVPIFSICSLLITEAWPMKQPFLAVIAHPSLPMPISQTCCQLLLRELTSICLQIKNTYTVQVIAHTDLDKSGFILIVMLGK